MAGKIFAFNLLILFAISFVYAQRDTVLSRVELATLRPSLGRLRPLFLNPQIGGKNGNPGLKLRITPRGLDYANSVAGNLLNAEIRKLRIPDFEKSISRGKVEARNIRITQFDPPTYRITTNSPNRIGWGLSGGKISIRGNWKGYKKVAFVKIRGSGSFSASASNLAVTVSADFRRNGQGQPLMSNVGCSARIGSLSVSIKGGIVGWILNLFRGKIASKLKPALEKEVCNQAKKFVQTDVNAKLRTFPTTASLSRLFKVNYRLTANPTVSGGSITTSHKGEISYLGRGGTTFYPHDLQTSSSNSKMLYLYGSDYVLNSFLSSAHKNHKIRYTLNEQTMPKIAKYLRTSCSDICLGTLFPDLEERYPNYKGSMGVETTRDPTALFSTGKATLNARGKIQLNLHQTGRRTVRVLSANVSLSADLNPRISSDFRKVSGNVEINSLRISGAESTIEELGQAELQGLVSLATPILEELANQQLEKGISIPVTRGIRLRNGQLRMLPRTIEISTDVTYTG